MRTIKITVTDGDGVVLDFIKIQTEEKVDRVAYRLLKVSQSERPDEEALIIGE